MTRTERFLPPAVLVVGGALLVVGVLAIVCVLVAPPIAWGGAGDGVGNRESDPGHRLGESTTITRTPYTIGQPALIIINTCDTGGHCSVAVLRDQAPWAPLPKSLTDGGSDAGGAQASNNTGNGGNGIGSVNQNTGMLGHV